MSRHEKEVYGKATLCKCPKCGKKHLRKMFWTGNGMPWKFCVACSLAIEVHDTTEAQFNVYAAVSRAQHARTT